MTMETSGLMSTDRTAIPLKAVEVIGDLTGRGAKIKILQEFVNIEDKAIEAVYKFPLPENSSVCGFRVLIGDRIIESEIEDKAKAFEKYDEAIVRGDGAYLLDEERPNIFTLSVGNLNPGDSAKIEITYVTLLDATSSDVRFFLPTTISPRYVPADMQDGSGIPISAQVNPVYAFDVPYRMKIMLNIQGSKEIATLSSPSHKIAIRYSEDSTIVEFAAEDAKMDRDFVVNITYKSSFESRAYYLKTDNDSYLQVDYTGKYNGATKPNKELIFVLDCSGSMDGSSIDEARKALEILIKALEPGMTFNIYRFGSSYEKAFDISVLYSEETHKKALEYLNCIQADLGGTEVLAPLQDIYKRKVDERCERNIILITDGQVGNESEVMTVIKKHNDTTRFFSIGIGHGPNEYFIKQIARSAKGAAELIAPGERIEPRIMKLYGKVLSPVIENIKISTDKADKSIVQSPTSPFVYAGETISIFVRSKPEANPPEVIKLTGTLEGRQEAFKVPVSIVSCKESPITFLWAKETIRELEEGISSGSKQLERTYKQIDERIVQLSKECGIISRETSFIAVEKRANEEKSTGEVILKKVPVMLTKDWGRLKESSRDIVCCHHSYSNAMSVSEPVSYMRSSSMGFPASSPRLKGSSRVMSKSSRVTDRIVNDGTEERTRLLLDICSAQKPNGGFSIDSYIAKRLGLKINDLKSITTKIMTKNDVDKVVLLSTSIVFNWLEANYSGEKSTWIAVVQKSYNWYKDTIKKSNPEIDGIALEEWVNDYMQKNSQIRSQVG